MTHYLEKMQQEQSEAAMQEANNRQVLFQEILETFQNKSETTLTSLNTVVEGMQKNAHMRDSAFNMEIKAFSEKSSQVLNTLTDGALP